MAGPEKPLYWVGASKRDLMELPEGVRRFFGHALHFAQIGKRHDAVKSLKGFGGAAILEVLRDDSGSTYRAVYTVRFAEAVFVLHCFQKKSLRGIETPKREMDILRERLKTAEQWAKEIRNEKARSWPD